MLQTLKKYPVCVSLLKGLDAVSIVQPLINTKPGFNIMEIWKDIKGYEGFYQISNKGRIKSFKRNRIIIMKPSKGSNNYYHISLSKINKKDRKTFSVHRLVAIAFILNPGNKEQTNHKNSIKTDNRVENREWCTRSYNALHSYKAGTRISPKYWLGKFGAEHHSSKAILQYDLNGKLLNIFGSITEAAKFTNTNKCNISKNCIGINKTHMGFIFKYKVDEL